MHRINPSLFNGSKNDQITPSVGTRSECDRFYCGFILHKSETLP